MSAAGRLEGSGRSAAALPAAHEGHVPHVPQADSTSGDPLAPDAGARTIALAVRERAVSASEVVARTLARIALLNPAINALTDVAERRAREQAQAIDVLLDRGQDPGPLAGVPFVVKANIDVRDLVTTAGSRLHAQDAPARRDAAVVAALTQAGAVCMGAANMDEFGLGGTTENACFGPTRNPHDLARTAGGSSGGPAAAVAAGMVPFSIGSDGLGSVRLPASLCGVYGLRPTRDRFSNVGVLGAGGSLSTPGPFARSAHDLALVIDAVVGNDDAQSALAQTSGAPTLRIGVADGYFEQNLDDDAGAAVMAIARTLRATRRVRYPEAALARAAATLVFAAEGGHAYLDLLRTRGDEFDPRTRDRFLAHALLPAAWYLRAQAFRAWHREQVLALLGDVDVILFPATPCVAPPLGTPTIRINGLEQPTGPSLGVFAQPLAPTGCPVLTVPVARREGLPLGVQLLARPHAEADLVRIAAWLESEGAVAACVGRAATAA